MLAQPDALARWTSEWERYQRDCGCGSGAVGALLGFTAALGYGLTRSQVASIADILVGLTQLSITTIVAAMLGKIFGLWRARVRLHRVTARLYQDLELGLNR